MYFVLQANSSALEPDVASVRKSNYGSERSPLVLVYTHPMLVVCCVESDGTVCMGWISGYGAQHLANRSEALLDNDCKFKAACGIFCSGAAGTAVAGASLGVLSV